jgi:hypothetical protein
MVSLQILSNIQLRIALSWVAARFIFQQFKFNLDIIPLLLVTIIITYLSGLFFASGGNNNGTELESTSFIPIDTQSPRLQTDILENSRHVEIIISKNGVVINE